MKERRGDPLIPGQIETDLSSHETMEAFFLLAKIGGEKAAKMLADRAHDERVASGFVAIEGDPRVPSFLRKHVKPMTSEQLRDLHYATLVKLFEACRHWGDLPRNLQLLALGAAIQTFGEDVRNDATIAGRMTTCVKDGDSPMSKAISQLHSISESIIDERSDVRIVSHSAFLAEVTAAKLSLGDLQMMAMVRGRSEIFSGSDGDKLAERVAGNGKGLCFELDPKTPLPQLGFTHCVSFDPRLIGKEIPLMAPVGGERPLAICAIRTRNTEAERAKSAELN